MSFATDGTITKIIQETMTVNSHACRGIYMNITQALVIVDFSNMSIPFIDKTDP